MDAASIAGQLIDSGVLPRDAWQFTIGEAATWLIGVRSRDELAWLRMGTMVSHLLAPHLKKGMKGPRANDFNPYAIKKKQLLNDEQQKDILAVVKSERAMKVLEHNKKRKLKRELNEQDKRRTGVTDNS